jgi:hypothetical protein
LALWHAWVCRGLFVDGAAFMTQIVLHEWFFHFYPPRMYAMILAQIPVIVGLKLGISDLHWLSRLLSLGLFALPTIFYTIALARARHDPVLLATVLAAIGLVFFTTSFFIVGEYNSIYAMTIAVAVVVASADRLTWRDGLLLCAIGILALRTYEAVIYLSPIIVPMILWRVWKCRARPILPALLYAGCAAGYVGGFFIALSWIIVPWDEAHRDEAAITIINFWQNMQFVLLLCATATVAVWALLRPSDLSTARPYLWAMIWLVLLVLSPLLIVFDSNQVRPFAKSQYVARTMGGGMIAAMIVAMWIYASEAGRRLRIVEAVRQPQAGRKLLALAALMCLSVCPSNAYLTATWIRYLDVFIDTVHSREGLIPYEETPLATLPHILLVEHWTIPSASLVLRASRQSGIVLTPREFRDWQPFNSVESHPELGRYFWRR